MKDVILYAGWKHADESKNWGDLALAENAEVKELFATADAIPKDFWFYDPDEAAGSRLWTEDFNKERDYTGSAITFPRLKVFYGKNMLKSGTDYTVKYTNNVKAGTGKLTITAKGNFAGTLPLIFAIKKLDLSKNVTAGDISLAYNGIVQKGTTTVLYDKADGTTIALKPGTDFTFVYPHTDKKDKETYDEKAFRGDPNVPMTYDVYIEGKGNYEGTNSFEETILPKTSDKIPVTRFRVGTIKAQTLSYADESSAEPIPATPEIKVTFGNELLTVTAPGSAEDGYYVTYDANDSVGTGYVCINGTGRYCGTKRVGFKINALPLSKATVSKPATGMTFTGKEITQEGYQLRYNVTKTSEGTLLKEGRDYVVSYSGNVNAGKKATIIYTGKGIYSGTVKKTYTIKPVDLKVNGERNKDILYYYNYLATYSKGATKPEIELVYDNGEDKYTLVQGKDYTVKYSGNTKVNADAGPKKKSTITVTGKGNFKGSLSFDFKIIQARLDSTQITASDVVYTGKAGKWKPSITLYDTNGAKLKAGTDYDTKNISYTYEVDGKAQEATDSTILDVGTVVTATVEGKGSYIGFSDPAEFRIVEASIAKASIKIKDQAYTGRQITITKDDITSIKLGKVELQPEDYEIVEGSYVKNKNTGTAKVTIHGLGKYGGTKVVSFKITKRKIK